MLKSIKKILTREETTSNNEMILGILSHESLIGTRQKSNS